MGRLRIKPSKRFVTIVREEPTTRRRQWFIAAMFTVGVLATLAGLVLLFWFALHAARGVTIEGMKMLGALPPGAGGTAALVEFRDIDEELRYLRGLVTEWRAKPQIRELALEIVTNSGAEPRDKKQQAIEIARWVQDNIYYIHELPERFQTPGETLRLKAGDCDDSTTLVCSLLESVGIPAKLVCMQINGAFAHIFPAAMNEKTGALLPLDTTMKTSVTDATNPAAWAEARGKRVALKII